MVTAVSFSPEYTFSKPTRDAITLIAGFGVEGDAHAGELVKHRYLVRTDATQPNLRQVHLIDHELFALLAEQGHDVAPGELGENIAVQGVDMASLPTGTILQLGDEATVELTGLRNPCAQIDDFQEGLMKRLMYQDENGNTVRLGGVMTVVLIGGVVKPGDSVTVDIPPEPHEPLVYIEDSHHPVREPGRR